MKIAAIYSGESRTFADCADNHFNEFFDGCDVDTYHSDWYHNAEDKLEEIERAPNIRGVGFTRYDAARRPDLKQFEKVLLTEKHNHPIFMLGRIQYMNYHAMETLLAQDKLDDYDLIVRMRYDFKFSGRLIDHIPAESRHGDLNGKIFCTRGAGGKSSSLNVWDGFAFGHPDVMQTYFNFHAWIPFSMYFDHIIRWKFQPEYVIGCYLRFCGLDVLDTQIVPTRVLPFGVEQSTMLIERTTQYYADLLDFHPEFWGLIENDCPATTNETLILELEKRGYDVPTPDALHLSDA